MGVLNNPLCQADIDWSLDSQNEPQEEPQEEPPKVRYFDKLLDFSHLKEVCMNYKEHFVLSMKFSYMLAKGSVFALIHAFHPDTYITKTSELVIDINKLLKENGCHKD